MKRGFLFFTSLILVWSLVSGQIPNSSWRDHLSYKRCIKVAITPNKVYAAAFESGVLCYTKASGEIEKLSKVYGLSDIGANALCYSSVANTLVIGYLSGNVDLINSEGVFNMTDIEVKRLASTKKINNIECNGAIAYLSCDFGIVAIDLEKKEVKDSYIFGPMGAYIHVNDVAFKDNYIYAATKIGLYKADLNGSNLLDYSNWEKIESAPANKEYKIIEYFSGKLYAVYTDTIQNKDVILQSDNNSWGGYTYTKESEIQSFDVNAGYLCITGNSLITVYNNQMNEVATYPVLQGKHSLMDENGKVYSASLLEGLKIIDGIGSEKLIRVECPRFNSTSKVFTREDQVWISSGGPFRPFSEGGAYNFTDERWRSINSGWEDNFDSVGSIYKMAYHPNNLNHIYAASFLDGIYEIEDYKVVKSHTWAKTPVFNTNLNEYAGLRVTGLDFDNKGDMWIICHQTKQPLFVLRSSGEWEHVPVALSIFSEPMSYADLLVSKSNQIWILTNKNGMIVLREESDGSISKKAFPLKNLEEEVISAAYCLTEDKDGNIWVGTNRGPMVYSSTVDIFNLNDIKGANVKLNRTDGSGLADYLLDYEVVNDIAVDGGNRKWLATENSGIFLISEDGQKTYHQFNVQNSQMISNNVIGIGVQEQTGEVFVSTNKGLISFMGTSTEGGDDFEDVYVYPNPIRPDYDGDITISGLIRDANVKITDISGNLVYETTSFGGQAIWDGKNFDGNRVHTGVYLVFMTNDDGTKTHITKLLFIH